jgi:hypothetical protein
LNDPVAEPEPILSTLLPFREPEWEYATVLGAPAGALLIGGDAGPVVVRRRVSFGRWEPVTPERFADDPTGSRDEWCGAVPPTEVTGPDGKVWTPGDCDCTRPSAHEGPHSCEPCAARYGAPEWRNPDHATTEGRPA